MRIASTLFITPQSALFARLPVILPISLVCAIGIAGNNSILLDSARANAPDRPEAMKSEAFNLDNLKKKGKMSLTPVPPILPDTLPVPGRNAATVAAPPSKGAQAPGSLRYELYNTFPRELDIWDLEGKRFIRGPAVIAPDRSAFVYSEVIFTPYNRQTLSRLYRVITVPKEKIVPEEPLSPGTAPASAEGTSSNSDAHDKESGDNEEADLPPVDPLPRTEAERFDPEKNLQRREVLLEVGYGKIRRFDFRTLTVVDWSVTGRRLLVKEKSGLLHIGLRTSDIVICDQQTGTVAIYPEVRRIIQYYWRTKGNLPNINRLNWELTPLGWEPGSDSVVLMKAWALDSREKKFLGVWRYDVDAERAELITLQNEPVPVAANGWLGAPLPDPKPSRHPVRRHTL